jgi:hypothetical protein
MMKFSADRRRSLLGLAAIAGGTALARPAQAFSNASWATDFQRASRCLQPYGVAVSGTDQPYDVVRFDVTPLAGTEYRHSVAGPGLHSVETVSRDDAATFTHLHDDVNGNPVPCIKTVIHDHALATHELIDNRNPTVPVMEVATEMVAGGQIGAITVLVNDVAAQLTIRVGARVYLLVNGQLVEQP